jgi:putative FmdB family regulatory protein
MPTYEYACSSCGNQWEEIQKISEAPLQECPKCHEQTARRQISGGRFILKGGGWYADLYSSVKPGKKDESKSTSSTATDAKPAGDSASSGSKDTGSKDSGASSSSVASTPASSGSTST